MKFAYLRDPLFMVCVAVYGLNRTAEHFGYTHWLLRGYLNDVICMAFWMPILVFGLKQLRLRPSDVPPRDHEIAIAFVVWATMFEVWFPYTETLGALTYADPWDVVCYAGGGIFAAAWWRWHYGRDSSEPAEHVVRHSDELSPDTTPPRRADLRIE